jgi:predicted metal-binding membrane protein
MLRSAMSAPASRRRFFCASALLFCASAALTSVQSLSMSAMGGMPMPGGWILSMTWMRMCGQTWPGAAASFLGMWVPMMVAMMLPSLLPVLWRYRSALRAAGETRVNALTVLAGVAYFCVWTALGLVVFTLGVALAALATHLDSVARAVPLAIGMVIMVAGALQFTRWKARKLACCREGLSRCSPLAADAHTAWRLGLRFGRRCSSACVGFTSILLVTGVMNLGAMVVVTAAITAERLAPAGEHVARAIGVVAFGAGLFLIAKTAALI